MAGRTKKATKTPTPKKAVKAKVATVPAPTCYEDLNREPLRADESYSDGEYTIIQAVNKLHAEMRRLAIKVEHLERENYLRKVKR